MSEKVNTSSQWPLAVRAFTRQISPQADLPAEIGERLPRID